MRDVTCGHEAEKDQARIRNPGLTTLVCWQIGPRKIAPQSVRQQVCHRNDSTKMNLVNAMYVLSGHYPCEIWWNLTQTPKLKPSARCLRVPTAPVALRAGIIRRRDTEFSLYSTFQQEIYLHQCFVIIVQPVLKISFAKERVTLHHTQGDTASRCLHTASSSSPVLPLSFWDSPDGPLLTVPRA